MKNSGQTDMSQISLNFPCVSEKFTYILILQHGLCALESLQPIKTPKHAAGAPPWLGCDPTG